MAKSVIGRAIVAKVEIACANSAKVAISRAIMEKSVIGPAIVEKVEIACANSAKVAISRAIMAKVMIGRANSVKSRDSMC